MKKIKPLLLLICSLNLTPLFSSAQSDFTKAQQIIEPHTQTQERINSENREITMDFLEHHKPARDTENPWFIAAIKEEGARARIFYWRYKENSALGQLQRSKITYTFDDINLILKQYGGIPLSRLVGANIDELPTNPEQPDPDEAFGITILKAKVVNSLAQMKCPDFSGISPEIIHAAYPEVYNTSIGESIDKKFINNLMGYVKNASLGKVLLQLSDRNAFNVHAQGEAEYLLLVEQSTGRQIKIMVAGMATPFMCPAQ